MNDNYDPENFKPGEMDIEGHTATFAGTMKVILYTSVATIAVLIFLLLIGT